MEKEFNPAKQKILLLLMTGAALSFTRSPKMYFRAIKAASKEWERINEIVLKQKIRDLYRSKLVSLKERDNDEVEIVLTEEGKKKALVYKLNNMEIPAPSMWDKKWRVVLFDVPEKKKQARDTLREKLKSLGFYELQKSVFVFPYGCENEIDFIIELFDVRPFVRYGILENIDNDLHLRKVFNLN